MVYVICAASRLLQVRIGMFHMKYPWKPEDETTIVIGSWLTVSAIGTILLVLMLR
jgi:hypothetical protein